MKDSRHGNGPAAIMEPGRRNPRWQFMAARREPTRMPQPHPCNLS